METLTGLFFAEMLIQKASSFPRNPAWNAAAKAAVRRRESLNRRNNTARIRVYAKYCAKHPPNLHVHFFWKIFIQLLNYKRIQVIFGTSKSPFNGASWNRRLLSFEKIQITLASLNVEHWYKTLSSGQMYMKRTGFWNTFMKDTTSSLIS